MIGQLIGAFVVILVGFSLFPVILESINDTIATNPDMEELGFVPYIFAIVIFLVALFTVINSLKQFYDYSEDEEEDKEENKDIPEKPHKQTYLEYVQERLKVEKLMK